MTDVVYVHPEPVRGSVHVKRLILLLFDQRIALAFQQADGKQAFGDRAHGALVNLFECCSNLHRADARLLCVQHDFVDRPLLRGEYSIDREGAGHVACVVVILTARVYQEQLAVVEHAVPRPVVKDRCVGPRTHDAFVGGALAPVLAKDVKKLGVNFVLVHARPCELHRAQVGVPGDRSRPAHRRDFISTFAEPHFVKVDGGVDDRLGRVHTTTAPSAEVIQAIEDDRIRLAVLSETIVKSIDVAEVVRELLCELFDGIRSVRTEVCNRAFQPGARTVPDLPLAFLWANEEDHLVLLVLIGEQQQALGLVEPRQVEEVAVLPVRVPDVVVAECHWSRWKQRDAIAHGFEKLLSARCKLRHRPSLAARPRAASGRSCTGPSSSSTPGGLCRSTRPHRECSGTTCRGSSGPKSR